MASLVPLIEKQIKVEAKQRGFLKTRAQYYIHLDKCYDGIIQFMVATYKHLRVVDVRIGVSHLEHERLYALFCDKTPPYYFKKKIYRFFSCHINLLSLMSPEEREKYHFGFEYYDEHPEMIENTTQQMFSFIDKYAFNYFNKMMDVDLIVNNCLSTNIRQVYFTSIPLLYLACGRKDDALHFLETALDKPEFQGEQYIDFYNEFINYDYDADPDKLPVV